MQIVKWLAAAAAASVLAGCASQPEIPFDKSVSGNIHTIGVLTPGMPEKPEIWLASDVGQSFGLVGALVDAGMQESRDKKFAAILVDQKVTPRDEFVHALQDSLKSKGYDVKTVDVARKESGFLKVYPAAAEAGADAYLDISGVNYGYVAAGIGKSTPYRPYIYLNCKLVRASNGEVLMQDAIFYDPVAPFGQGKNVSISPDPAYTFVDFDALQNSPKLAVDGMNASFHATADALGHLMQ